MCLENTVSGENNFKNGFSGYLKLLWPFCCLPVSLAQIPMDKQLISFLFMLLAIKAREQAKHKARGWERRLRLGEKGEKRRRRDWGREGTEKCLYFQLILSEGRY